MFKLRAAFMKTRNHFLPTMHPFMMIMKWLLGGVLLLITVSCKSHTEKLVQLDHQLVDKIWDTQQARFISRNELFARLPHSQYLLLGETHDNLSHHQHQADIIAALANQQKKASVHFEMIDDIQARQLDATVLASVDSLIDYLAGTQAGWDYRNMYRPVFTQTLKAGYLIFPANLDYDQIRNIFAEGESVVPVEMKALMNNVKFSDDQLHSLQQEIIEGHCNVMPEHMLSPMMLTQRTRDARMAQSLLMGDSDFRVLIAGSGHTRHDRGVPIYIRAQQSSAR
ncbi:MAG: hypothetical protein EP315_07315, partial [Gammaproteobacteria bacterium]